MSALHGDTKLGVLADVAKSFANAHGVKDDAKIKAAAGDLQSKLGPFVATRDLPDSEVRALATQVLKRSLDAQSGRFTVEDLKKESANTLQVLKDKYGRQRAPQLLASTNAHLREHEPELHKVLNGAHGSHPRVVLPLVAEQAAREAEAERKARSAKYVAPARKAAAALAPRAGTTAGGKST